MDLRLVSSLFQMMECGRTWFHESGGSTGSSLLSAGQVRRNHRQICLCPVQSMHLLRGDPGNRGVLVQNHLSLPKSTDEGIQSDREISVTMTAFRKLSLNMYGYAQLFQKFTFQALPWRLTGFDFPTREFPFERQAHGLMSLGCQDQVILFNNGTRDMEVTLSSHVDTPDDSNHATGNLMNVVPTIP
jgi:hypothetical protein